MNNQELKDELDRELEEAEALEGGYDEEVEQPDSEQEEAEEIQDETETEEVEEESSPEEAEADPEQEKPELNYDGKIPLAKHTQLKRSARKLERKATGLEKSLKQEKEARQALEAELQEARQVAAFAKSHGMPEVPDEVDIQAVRSGDPDAIADALLKLQAPTQTYQQPVQQEVKPEVTDESQPSLYELTESAPDDSPVHDLVAWFDESDSDYSSYAPVRDIAKSVEAEVLARPEYQGANPLIVLTEVARQVQDRISGNAETQEARKTPQSLTTAAGVSSSKPKQTLMEQWQNSPDENKFLASLSVKQMEALEAELTAAS